MHSVQFASYFWSQPVFPADVYTQGAPLKEYTISRIRTKNTLAETPKSASIGISSLGMIESVCDHSEKFFGYPTDQLIGFPFNKLVPASVYDPNAPHFRDLLARGDSIETTFQHKTGFFFIARMQLSAEKKSEEFSPKEYSIAKMAPKTQPTSLADCQQFARLGVWEYLSTSRSFTWSDGVFKLFELEPGADINPEHALYYFHEDQHKIKGAFRRCLQSGESWSIDLQIITARNKVRQVRVAGKGHTQNGKVTRMTGIIQDISEIHQARKEKSFIHNCVNGILQSSDDLILTLDSNLKVILLNGALNKQFEATFGETLQIGQPIMNALTHHPNEKRIYQRLWERALTRDSFCVEMPLAQREEDMPVYEMHFHRIIDNDGELLGACSIAKNITSRINVQEKLNYMARHDPLTGLYNRREFQNLLGRSIGNAKKRGTVHSLLYMDLENFYQLNDQAGQSAGDTLLREVGQILSSKVRQRDAIARIGSDEFAALLENCGDQEAERVAEGIRDAIRDFEFSYQDRKYKIGISIGVVAITDLSDSPAKLMKLADNVCYAAKTAGENRVHVYRPKALSQEAEEKSLATIDLIKRALEFNDYFKLFAQSIKPITSAVWGDYFEVFVRIFDERGNLVLPDEFLPTAEEYDITRDIDLLVVGNALKWLKSRGHLSHRLKQMFINVSDCSARHPGFTEKLIQVIQQSRVDPAKLCFEVTERFFLYTPELAQDFIHALKPLGCAIAIDNAGAEASNYEYLTHFDVDYVKISGTTMNQVATDPIKLVMVDALHRIASISGKQTIGHHIADDHCLAEARKLGLHFGQGIKLGDVMAVADFDEHQSPAAPNKAAPG